MILILVLLFVSLAAGQTQTKTPCCYPDSWQATVVDVGTEFSSEEVDGELEEFTVGKKSKSRLPFATMLSFNYNDKQDSVF